MGQLRTTPKAQSPLKLFKLSSPTMWEGKGGKEKLRRGREANHKKLLDTENKLRADGGGGEGKAGDGHGGGHLLG